MCGVDAVMCGCEWGDCRARTRGWRGCVRVHHVSSTRLTTAPEHQSTRGPHHPSPVHHHLPPHHASTNESHSYGTTATHWVGTSTITTDTPWPDHQHQSSARPVSQIQSRVDRRHMSGCFCFVPLQYKLLHVSFPSRSPLSPIMAPRPSAHTAHHPCHSHRLCGDYGFDRHAVLLLTLCMVAWIVSTLAGCSRLGAAKQTERLILVRAVASAQSASHLPSPRFNRMVARKSMDLLSCTREHSMCLCFRGTRVDLLRCR